MQCFFSLQFTKGHPDGLHLQEIRHIAIILMAMAFTHFLTRKSMDKATEISLLWSRTVVRHTWQSPIIKFLVIVCKVKTRGKILPVWLDVSLFLKKRSKVHWQNQIDIHRSFHLSARLLQSWRWYGTTPYCDVLLILMWELEVQLNYQVYLLKLTN